MKHERYRLTKKKHKQKQMVKMTNDQGYGEVDKKGDGNNNYYVMFLI